MVTLYDDLPEETIEKFKPLLARPVEVVKEEIDSLTQDYYKFSIDANEEELVKVIERINFYLELDVPEVNNYFMFSFINSMNNILRKLYRSDLEFYLPENPNLYFITKHERQARYFIEKENLTPSEVEDIIEYNIQSSEVHGLASLGLAFNSIKPKKKLPIKLAKSVLLNINYTGEHGVETIAKYFYALNHNGVLKE